ncbi:MAG: putative 2-aminoethylphosphonate ABC transporter ATP-binding protein [Chloroflexota bacterium]
MKADETATERPYLRVRNITKTFGSLVAVDDVSLDVAKGELVTLLGPSGCGKTTLLRIVAGLEVQDAGEIYQNGIDISRLPPRQRDFGIVFQSYALFPNLTAGQNIAYGLENRRLGRQAINARVNELLTVIGLPEVRSKYPAQLSGGQQQRIALARALATAPGLLLLDEPLSALDARVRVSLRVEIKHLQRRVGVTTIFVTHDQEEALVMADRIVVMNGGHIEQVGTPEEIYHQPATPFVADFIGVMNFLPATADGDPRRVRCGTICLQTGAPHDFPPGTSLVIAVRPEEVRVGAAFHAESNVVPARVEETEFLGSFCRLTLRLEGLEQPVVIAEVPSTVVRDQSLKPGGRLQTWLPPDMLRLYPRQGEPLL